MKKAYLISYNGLLNVGGVERVCFYLNSVLAKNNITVKIVDRYIYPHWLLCCLGKGCFYLFPFISFIYVILKRRKEDLVISNSYISFLLKTDYLFIHGTTAGIRNVFHKKGWGLFAYLEKIAACRAKNIVAVSLKTKEEIMTYYAQNPSKINVLNNPVDTDIFYPKKKTFCEQKIILFCGRLESRKGVDELEKLSGNLEKQNDFRLKIATNSKDEALVFRNRRNTEIYYGLSLEKMNDFYNSGDILYFPSRYEGFEMITLEALSAGIPVIGTAVGAIKELSDRHEPAVQVINNKESLLPQFTTLIDAYSSYENRISLHNFYKEKYSIDSYKSKIEKLMKLK